MYMSIQERLESDAMSLKPIAGASFKVDSFSIKMHGRRNFVVGGEEKRKKNNDRIGIKIGS